MTRNSLTNLLLAIMCSLSVWGAAGPGAWPVPAAGEGLPGPRQSCSREAGDRYYTLTARVRLLLLWISRPGVGAGRITWSRDGGSSELALLIGSDPARAPMKINRWGYIVERVSESCAELVGIMTEAEEHSLEQARVNLGRSGTAHSFRAIRSRIRKGMAQSSVIYLKVTEDFTYHEVDMLLQRIPQEGARVRSLSLPAGAEPGFLFAVRNLIDESVGAYRRSGASGVTQHALRHYAFSGSLFELRRYSIREVPEIIDQRLQVPAAARNRVRDAQSFQRAATHFVITYGTQDPIDGIPVRIVYRPRWWFEAELLLDGDAAASQAARGGTPWKSGAN